MEIRAEGEVALKALVVRFSAIGDCVMAVPVAAAIRLAHPEARIVWAVEPWCAPVIDTDGLVNRVVLFPKRDRKRRGASALAWRDTLRRYLELRREQFDIGLDLQGHSKTGLCLRLAKPARRIAVPGSDAFARRLNPQFEPTSEEVHVVERNLTVLARLGEYDSAPRWTMPKIEPERCFVQPMLPSNRPLATIAVSAGWRPKDYPAELWDDVATRLLSKGWKVAFVGGPEDSAPVVEGTTDLVGKLTLAQSMAAIAMSDVHLSADTGPGHIAAAYGVPVVSVFGATPALRFRPYTERGIVLEAPGGPTAISPAQIVDAANRLLEEKSAPISH